MQLKIVKLVNAQSYAQNYIGQNVSPVEYNRVYFVGRFTNSGIVKPIINFNVGIHGGQEGIEVCLVGIVIRVVANVITVLGSRGDNKMNESDLED